MAKFSVGDLVQALKSEGIDIESILAKLRKEQEPERGPGGNTDFIAHGSEEHMALLGLVRAEEGFDGPVSQGYRLADPAYSELDNEKATARALAQRVSDLTTTLPEFQSQDPRKPFFCPTMWRPDSGLPFRQNTEER